MKIKHSWLETLCIKTERYTRCCGGFERLHLWVFFAVAAPPLDDEELAMLHARALEVFGA